MKSKYDTKAYYPAFFFDNYDQYNKKSKSSVNNSWLVIDLAKGNVVLIQLANYFKRKIISSTSLFSTTDILKTIVDGIKIDTSVSFKSN